VKREERGERWGVGWSGWLWSRLNKLHNIIDVIFGEGEAGEQQQNLLQPQFQDRRGQQSRLLCLQNFQRGHAGADCPAQGQGPPVLYAGPVTHHSLSQIQQLHEEELSQLREDWNDREQGLMAEVAALQEELQMLKKEMKQLEKNVKRHSYDFEVK